MSPLSERRGAEAPVLGGGRANPRDKKYLDLWPLHTLTASPPPQVLHNTMADVELAQLKPAAAPVSKKSSWSRMFVALAAAVAASAATAYAVQHKNRSGDSQVSLQRRLGDLILSPEELGDSIHEDSWTCVPEEDDCDLFSRSCLRIDSETCAKKYFGEEANAKYGSEDKCLEQNGVNGFVTQWCPEKPLLAGCNSANRCIFRKEANGKIISKPKGKDNGACTFDCPTYTELRDDAMTVISSPPPLALLLARTTARRHGWPWLGNYLVWRTEAC